MKSILVFLIVLLVNFCATGQENKGFPYLNPALSLEERVDDLVARMTVDEKIGQMVNAAPAIERLGKIGRAHV